jgi:hypothetical protein
MCAAAAPIQPTWRIRLIADLVGVVRRAGEVGSALK